jgi:hypothetical protein
MHFPTDERAHLLASPQIGPGLVARLEAAGFHSLAQMRRLGADAVMGAVCMQAGNAALANRTHAVQRALAMAPAATAAAGAAAC